MAQFSIFWPAYLVLALLLPQSSAWTFLWRNETTNAHIENGQSAQNCTQAWHQEGKQFSWDPEGTWCLKLYSDAKCGHTNGIACEPYIWRKDASQNISAFLVYPMPPSSITAFGLDETTSVTPTATPMTTATSTRTDAEAEDTATSEAGSGDHGGLSGGAIAGIVVGAIAAAAVLCAVFFFLGLRIRKRAAAAAADSSDLNTRTDPSSPHPENPSSNAMLFQTGPMVAELPKPPFVETQYVPDQANHTQPPNGVRMMELPGHDPGHELSNSAQVQEMVGTTQVQELEGDLMEKPKS